VKRTLPIPSLQSERPSRGESTLPSGYTLKHLLVPLDFSHASIKALDYARALVTTCGAQLYLVHVCDYDYTSTLDGLVPIAPADEVIGRWKKRLQDAAAKSGATIAPENIHVVHGRAFDEICRLAKTLQIDLIVTSTRGHTGLKHVLLGSTAERVLQHAPCPALVVRTHEHEAIRMDTEAGPSLELKKILVPLDFSECSLAGLEFAVSWAHLWKARLVLFHSIPPNNLAVYEGVGARGFPVVDLYVDEAAEGGVREVASRMLQRGVAVETKVEAGPPAARICEYAETNGIDLIITSTHGMTGFLHAVMGSTAEHIVRYAHCPVLVVPTRKTKWTRK
jgi:nucleotide-binding universal stress UspA family protein